MRPMQILYRAGLAYTTNWFHGTVSEVNAAALAELHTFRGMRGPDGIAAGPGARFLYVANYSTPETAGGEGIVTVLDRWSGAVAGEIPVGRNPANIAVSIDSPPVCPELAMGGNICVEAPDIVAGGSVTMSYALVPGLSASGMDALLGVLTPWGDIYAFNWEKDALRLLPPNFSVADIERVGNNLDGTRHLTGALTWPVPTYVPEGDYRFIGALTPHGSNRVLQVVYGNTVRVR